MYDTQEISDEIKDSQQAIIYLDLEMNSIAMYQSFYQQHKLKHGTFRDLKNPEYSLRMQERYNSIFCKINETIESKLQYQRSLL